MSLVAPVTLAQYAKVCERVCAEKSLSPDARSMLLCCFLRFYAHLKPLPIPYLPLPKEMTLKEAHLASNELHERKMGQKVKKADGWYFLIDTDCEILRLPKIKQSPLAAFTALSAPKITTHEVMTAWLQTYRDTFGHEYKRASQDLVRYRLVLRKLGGPKTLQVIKEFMEANRTKPAKVTTMRFYFEHGRRK